MDYSNSKRCTINATSVSIRNLSFYSKDNQYISNTHIFIIIFATRWS